MDRTVTSHIHSLPPPHDGLLRECSHPRYRVFNLCDAIDAGFGWDRCTIDMGLLYERYEALIYYPDSDIITYPEPL